MRVLVSWLRDFVAVDVGVRELADALTGRGFEVSAVEPPPATLHRDSEDAVLDLEITTNRPDCLGMLGVAREVSAILGVPLRQPAVDPPPAADGTLALKVVLDDPDLCPRYVAAAADVTLGPSPDWMAARLEAAGVRPVNNVVDITNYVMLELGHPMHAFDLAKLAGATLRIRRAAPGERLQTLDGETRDLGPDVLVIADARRPQAVAGVMGGAASEVTGITRRIALESAWFLPTAVRRTSRQLALATEASYRFERGADIEAPVAAMDRALTLLAQTGAGRAFGAVSDRYPAPRTRTVIDLRAARIERVLGVAIDRSFVPRTLGRLGFAVTDAAESAAAGRADWLVTVPSFRVDVHREIDCIEEVARHFGYERLPSVFPALRHTPAPPDSASCLQAGLRQVLTAAGCSEAITYGCIAHDAARAFVQDPAAIVPLRNPLSDNFAVLRPSLLPGLIDALIRNRRREARDVRLFEIGRRFDRVQGETDCAAVAILGSQRPEHWSAPNREVDLFDIKGIVERVCEALGAAPVFDPAVHPALVEGLTAGIAADGQALGHLGELSPDIARGRGLPAGAGALYVAELAIAPQPGHAGDARAVKARPIPRYPAVVRDIALAVDADLPAATVRGTIADTAPDTLVEIREFDRYSGKEVPDGRVSLALHLTFRAPDRTLTEAEVHAGVEEIVAALVKRHGAMLR